MHHPSTHTPASTPTTIVGRGRVGGSIAAALSGAGFEVETRDRAGVVREPVDSAVVLLCVPDAEIEAACNLVVGSTSGLQAIGHTSGATGLGPLRAAADLGIGAFSLHPLQTVPTPTTDLTGAPAAIAGSHPEALAVARSLTLACGMEPFEVPEEARAAYHAAAAMASNFLVALEESAVSLLDAAGIEDGRELLAPLVLRTAANWAEHGGDVLTGPIARGDEVTVQRHLEAIERTAPELAESYRALAERTRAAANAGARS
jgi:predicted short-subunit dehydrogenase-like oxidoreductase (DUF2520 family)